MLKVIGEFKKADVQPEHGGWVEGTIEVAFNGKNKVMRAWQRFEQDGTLKNVEIKGFAFKYLTGKKVWPGDVTMWPSGNLQNDHAGYAGQIRRKAPLLVGFWDEMNPAAKAWGQK